MIAKFVTVISYICVQTIKSIKNKDMTTERIDSFLNEIAGIETCAKLQDMLNEIIPDNTYIFLTCETGPCVIPTITGKSGSVKLVLAPAFRKINGYFYVANSPAVVEMVDEEIKPENMLPYDSYNYNAFIAILQDYKEGHYVDLDMVK